MELSSPTIRDASMAPYSRLESLHTELLELVCGYVARMSDLTHHRFRCMNQPFEAHCDTPGRKDLKALRLVSRRFATLHTPCEGLFRDFHLLVTDDSIARLEGVASHPRLRRHVSRITFFAPIFYRSQTDYLEFQDALERQVEDDLFQRLPILGWSQHERCAMIHGLMEHCYPYSPRQIGDAWTAYCNLYNSQQRLLEDGTFVSRVAKSLSACPRITRAFIPLRDPYRSPYYFDTKALTPAERATRPDWMTTYHPEVLQRTHLWEPMDTGKAMKDKAHRHFSWATSVLAQTNLQLHELVTDEHSGFAATFDWNNLINPPQTTPTLTATLPPTFDISHLRRLHLTPLTEDGELNDGDWSGNLSPLLKQTPNLTELSLRFGQMQAEPTEAPNTSEKHHRAPTFHQLLDFHFPRLRDFHLEFLRFPAKTMAAFLTTHTALQNLTLGHVYAEDLEWKPVFDAIKSHPRIVDVELCDLRRTQALTEVAESEHACVSTRGHAQPEKNVSRLRRELNSYVVGRGGWTERLAMEWEV